MEYGNILKMEKQIFSLPKEEQLRLIEKIIHHLRHDDQMKKKNFEYQLSKMARDKEIQEELGKINEEFLVTENDGLD